MKLGQALGIMLLLLAGVIIFRRFTERSDLGIHLEEQQDLQEVGTISTAVDNAALREIPLTTIGDTPLAGVQLDPFDPFGIQSMTGRIELFQPTPQDPFSLDSLRRLFVNN